jgi:arabinofuranosyltransferase
MRRWTGWIVAAAAACFVLVLLDAWLSDDAFITLRTVENFLAGRGLTWNPDERVQVYTHPLWMLVLSAAGFVTGELYHSVYAASLLFTAAFLLGLVRLHGKDPRALVLVLLVLSASNSFVAFGTGGLENPLTHVLLCLAYWVLWDRPAGARQVFWLSLLLGLGMLTRLDCVLLFAPAWVAGAWRALAQPGERRERRGTLALRLLRVSLLGLAPLVAWELFSLLYYGSLVPNVYHAKLDTGVPTAQYVDQGIRYFFGTCISDPLIFLVIPFALVLTLVRGHRHMLPATVACLLWLAYVVKIGGDFMVGRHFTPAIVLAALILARCRVRSRPVFAALLAVVVAGGILAPLSPWKYTPGYDTDVVIRRLGAVYFPRGLGDERAGGFPMNGLLRRGRGEGQVVHKWAQRGMRMRAELAADPAARRVMVVGAIGQLPFFAGPQLHAVDPLALADPLLARIPWIDATKSRIGHQMRILPEGYVESLESGTNRIADPDLAAAYDSLRLVVSSERLWSRARLRAIWAWNTGAFDARIAAYVARGRAKAGG